VTTPTIAERLQGVEVAFKELLQNERGPASPATADLLDTLREISGIGHQHDILAGYALARLKNTGERRLEKAGVSARSEFGGPHRIHPGRSKMPTKQSLVLGA